MSLRRKASARRREENEKFEKKSICKAFKEIIQYIYIGYKIEFLL